MDAFSTHKYHKMIHMSLISCETDCIYAHKNKKAQRKLRKEQALIQSDVSGKIFLIKIRLYSHNLIITKKWLYIYMILLQKSNLFQVTEIFSFWN